MYDVIVLGATFAAAGIAQGCGSGCLVLEQRSQAGYEFFSALSFGTGYDRPVRTPQAEQLRKGLSGQGIYGGDRHIYPLFGDATVLFGMKKVSVRKTETGFACLCHGIEGFETFEAKCVIDTCAAACHSAGKTYNLLIQSREAPDFEGISWESMPLAEQYLLRCPVPLSCDYVQARQVAWNVMRRFSQDQRLILSADEFDYRIAPGYPRWQEGILYLPSKNYENPALALEAGMLAWEEAKRNVSF